MSCRVGACKNYNDLRAMANALVQVEAQFDLMPDEPPPPSEEDRRLASGFEANVEQIALMLRSGIHDNQIIAMRKTNPDRAAHLAELLGVMQKDLRRIEVALREMAVQAGFPDRCLMIRLCSPGGHRDAGRRPARPTSLLAMSDAAMRKIHPKVKEQESGAQDGGGVIPTALKMTHAHPRVPIERMRSGSVIRKSQARLQAWTMVSYVSQTRLQSFVGAQVPPDVLHRVQVPARKLAEEPG